MSSTSPLPSLTLPPGHFENLFSMPAPWRLPTSRYERDKCAATLAILRPSYRYAFEVGCSTGVLTRALADRCRSLLAIDSAIEQLAVARQRCADLPHVRFARMAVPADRPIGRYDLIVLSEVLCSLDQAGLQPLARLVRDILMPDGEVVLVHETNGPLSGDEASERFIAELAGVVPTIRQQRTDRYRLDLLRRSTEIQRRSWISRR